MSLNKTRKRLVRKLKRQETKLDGGSTDEEANGMH